MKHNKMFLLVLMLVPWFSVPLLGRRALKRFYPGALFTFVWILFESIFAGKRLWWKFYEKLTPMGELPFMIGPFFVGSLWILKFTFGNFFRYLFLNLIIDAFFVYPGMIILRKMKIVSLIRMKHYQMGILFLSKSVVMYGFQYLVEKIRKKPKTLMQKIFLK
ncbi:hypothetical protein QE429_004421 [Bacillus sp. SORGH_AS 510]|uniref:hypothetical protein n=1 Tax=Bacillus sp. SORGH_AS_0510 TaxID=3041771 RepID=UPI002781704F|nr:hypothetical protein [Bacillus sp. SORGH_AS_0510]MDQ1147594.1 hypothetical protein [Bacillus sp. SORGH_AS_0510]